MPLIWDGPRGPEQKYYGTDDTNRIFGEIKPKNDVVVALHLGHVVGRYLDVDSAQIAIDLVHERLSEDGFEA